jgi:integrase
VLGRLSPHPSQQRGYLAALNHFFEFLVAAKLRKDNPVAAIGKPPAAPYVPRPLDYEACCRYLAAARGISVAHEALGTLGLYQGFRKSEIASAQWSWFFWGEGEMWVDVTGKGNRLVRVYVHHETRALLERVRASHRDPTWLFPSPVGWGSHISGAWIHKAHHAICREAGIEGATLHQLRHSFATWLGVRGKADIFVVSRGMRHRKVSSTEIYREMFPLELKDPMDRLSFEASDDQGSADGLRGHDRGIGS